jgi:hypothetical protein
MKQDFTEIAVVLDASESMAKAAKETISSYNDFLAAKKAGAGNIALAIFADKAVKLPKGGSLKAAKKLSKEDYAPAGKSALFDTLGNAIDDLGKRLYDTPEADRPGKVVLFVATDGKDNASKKVSLDALKEKVHHQSSVYSWEFIFHGAALDQFAVTKDAG